ncbi:MAG: zinc ABC transporter ATP-binding protein ZnuC [SAR86 cluster bacterium]|uniref:Zinc ABC transporter ATP-binding protein ZnuC n=1 Tax=SAR86 cluster bacterium TaxID=2030880 RepID=A0A2A4X373_9GAMM|nr:MAG: zinc ABC transporter ATP-binding protein ZnuC [SAR86 cluster bacterium]
MDISDTSSNTPSNSSTDTNAPGILLAAESINKDFAEKKILENISLTIEEGQIVTLIGPNGAGKTTLVRIALRLLQPDSGSIYHRPALRIGYMPQRVHVEPTLPLTVNRFLQLANRQDKALLSNTLEDLKIGHLEDQQLAAVSGGELQRVLLARALLRKPELLILDEPAQGVDLAGQAELYQLISEISDRHGCGVLMISHDLHLVMSSTDEVICLNHHICCHGKPEHVTNDPAYLNLFGANASQNLAVYTHHHDHDHEIGGSVKEHHHD